MGQPTDDVSERSTLVDIDVVDLSIQVLELLKQAMERLRTEQENVEAG